MRSSKLVLAPLFGHVEWEKERDMVRNMQAQDRDIIALDVRGATDGFKLPRKFLTQFPGSAMEAMFSERHEIQKTNKGRIYLDKDPDVFKLIVSYIDNGMKDFEIPNSDQKKRFL